MSIKTYVLLDALKPTAPIYYQADKQNRVRIETIPIWKPYMQLTFMDAVDKKNKTIRLKLNSNTPYQDVQIKEENIPANTPYTPDEYNAIKFRHNVLITDNPVVQEFLEVSPQIEGFKGRCDAIKGPSYKIYDRSIEVKSENKLFKDRLAAANKINDLQLNDAQEMLIRIRGSFYTPPTSIEECQNELINFIDEGDDSLAIVLKEETNIDDQNTIMLGKLINGGVISFDAVPDQVAKRKGDGWINLKEIPNEYPLSERKRLFEQFLSTTNGKLLLEDLQNDLKELNALNEEETPGADSTKPKKGQKQKE